MKNKTFIFEELKEISPLTAQIRKINVYSVSPSYFNDLSLKIIKKIQLKETLHNLSPVTPYSIPTNYFESLSNRVLEKISLNKEHSNEVFEETEAIAPLLNTISKNPVYTIPSDFFETREMPYIGIKKEEAKVIPLYTWSKFSRISAAAVVILSLSIGYYTIMGKKNITPSAASNAKDQVKNLSKEEIVHYLKSNIPIQNVTSVSRNKSKSENAIKSSLKEVSDKEIQQFLKETGESEEI